MKISNDLVVTIEYTVKDKQGNIIDSSDDNEALSFIQGKGKVFSGLEAALMGRSSGERLSVSLEPDQAYGARNEELVKQIPRERFNFDDQIQPGMKLKTKKGDRVMAVTVTEVTDDLVTVDANHPLAGVSIDIDLVIISVREAIEEELRSGEVQEMDEIYSKETHH